MIIYSVTVTVSDKIYEEWLQWMKEVHIQEVVDTGCFLECRMSKVLNAESEGHTYWIQYLCESEEKMETYQKHHAAALQKDHTEKYQGEFSAFRTMLGLEKIFIPNETE